MLRPQQTAKRKRGFESAVRGAMGRALIRTNKELGQAVGMTETQMSYRMSGKTKWSIEEVWALDSVLQQSWSNLELIVIDDASPDATWQVLQECSDPRVRLSRNEHAKDLARRALRSGAAASRARDWAWRGLKLDAAAFFSDARRGWMTLLSALIAPLLPRAARLRVFA